MTDPQEFPEDDPRNHSTRLKNMMSDVVTHARDEVGAIGDPKGQTLFETTAEVLTGLITAFERYEQDVEDTWR
ncbi:hypothetical protein [Mycobacterium sp. URHB0044]|jgi:hypothetical protein|uniref:hypothetical protein n=1 Tax=Mycobacterium sp. URHB0044 TaxID=1380386 RepID=UPI00048F70F7|nr:hypothetical protein [Mycobacterium sp. URHB0044]